MICAEQSCDVCGEILCDNQTECCGGHCYGCCEDQALRTGTDGVLCGNCLYVRCLNIKTKEIKE